MRNKLLIMVVAACSGGDKGKTDSGVYDTSTPDAPGILPVITSFIVTPSTVPANTPTTVTWNWTYYNQPTIPEPTCTVDNGVGPLHSGDSTQVTQTATTVYKLTCLNYVGSAGRSAIVTIPNATPTIATFTATPTTLPSTAATRVACSCT